MKDFKLGSNFSSWKVVKCVDKKKYRFLCECSCGNKKVFYKYNLLAGKYAICKECNTFKIDNLKEIKKYWNKDLNGDFTKIQDYDMSKKYWFLCKENHNFKSNLKNFSLKNCTTCSLNKVDELNLEYYRDILSLTFGKVTTLGSIFLFNEIKIAFHLHEEDRFSRYFKYFENEEQMLDEMIKIKHQKLRLKKKNIKIIDIPLVEDKQGNIALLKEKIYTNIEKLNS